MTTPMAILDALADARSLYVLAPASSFTTAPEVPPMCEVEGCHNNHEPRDVLAVRTSGPSRRDEHDNHGWAIKGPKSYRRSGSHRSRSAPCASG
jgi:hypothetical protein